MKLLIRPKALKALDKIAFYVESLNTRGSGERFLDEFLTQVDHYAISEVHYQPCNHPSLASYGYSCIFYEKWVIAFKIEGNNFIICRIMWGPSLS